MTKGRVGGKGILTLPRVPRVLDRRVSARRIRSDETVRVAVYDHGRITNGNIRIRSIGEQGCRLTVKNGHTYVYASKQKR